MKRKGCKVKVIIPNWNGKKFLEKCLPSLYLQTFKNFHTVIIDNNSRDDSINFIKKTILWSR